jgi:hypothetical protein
MNWTWKFWRWPYWLQALLFGLGCGAVLAAQQALQ